MKRSRRWQGAINTSGIRVCRKRLVNDPSSKDRISIGGFDRVVWRRFPGLLAMLGDSTNDTQGSKESMSKARYWYTASGRADHSDSEMKAALKLADEHLDRLGLQ
jgi:hypothetical protein